MWNWCREVWAWLTFPVEKWLWRHGRVLWLVVSWLLFALMMWWFLKDPPPPGPRMTRDGWLCVGRCPPECDCILREE